MDDAKNHAGRTESEQAAWEARCDAWDRIDDRARERDEYRQQINASSRAWGEW